MIPPGRGFELRANLTKLLCGLALGAALTGPAMAEERLVMPFTCQMAGGQVSLAPSAPQAYQIYGEREHRRLTTCSPYDSRKCHNWSVHRFDLDCGGVRTSWQSVVAALTPMLAESIGTVGNADDGPYEEPAYAPGGPAGAYRPGPGGRIDFPPGFAPNPMRVAKFERTEAQTAHVPLPPKKPDAPAPTQIAEAKPGPEPEAATSPSSGKAETASKTKAEPKAKKVAEHRALKIEVDPEVTGALPKAQAGSLWRDAATIFKYALAVLFALWATLFLGRRGMLALPMLPMPFARLAGPAGLPMLSARANVGSEEAADEACATPASRLRLWDEDWLPRTKSEALAVLGVDPRANSDRIKSTVKRLRRALHPDHALDDEDRLLRERRLKQINVAWEIVSRKRRAPWLSIKPRSS